MLGGPFDGGKPKLIPHESLAAQHLVISLEPLTIGVLMIGALQSFFHGPQGRICHRRVAIAPSGKSLANPCYRAGNQLPIFAPPQLWINPNAARAEIRVSVHLGSRRLRVVESWGRIDTRQQQVSRCIVGSGADGLIQIACGLLRFPSELGTCQEVQKNWIA